MHPPIGECEDLVRRAHAALSSTVGRTRPWSRALPGNPLSWHTSSDWLKVRIERIRAWSRAHIRNVNVSRETVHAGAWKSCRHRDREARLILVRISGCCPRWYGAFRAVTGASPCSWVSRDCSGCVGAKSWLADAQENQLNAARDLGSEGVVSRETVTAWGTASGHPGVTRCHDCTAPVEAYACGYQGCSMTEIGKRATSRPADARRWRNWTCVAVCVASWLESVVRGSSWRQLGSDWLLVKAVSSHSGCPLAEPVLHWPWEGVGLDLVRLTCTPRKWGCVSRRVTSATERCDRG